MVYLDPQDNDIGIRMLIAILMAVGLVALIAVL